MARPFKTESKTGKKYLIWEKEKEEHCAREIEKKKEEEFCWHSKVSNSKAETKVKVGTLKVTKVKWILNIKKCV